MKGKKFSQEEIKEGLIKGYKAILEHLYLKVKPKAIGYILKRGGTEDEMDDIFQIIIIILRHKLIEKKIEINNIENYIITACKNEWLRNKEKNKKENKNLEAYFYDQSKNLNSTEEDDVYDNFVRAFKMLKPDCQEFFKLKSNGLKYKEISTKLNISEKFAKTKNARCLQYFKEIYNTIINHERRQ